MADATANVALQLAVVQNNSTLVDSFHAQVQCYQFGFAFRDPTLVGNFLPPVPCPACKSDSNHPSNFTNRSHENSPANQTGHPALARRLNHPLNHECRL
jgi:hypothetical protein